MLQTIREFAQQTLADMGELQRLRMVHAEYFAGLARTAEPEMFDDDQYWPDRLDLEHDNLRAALRRFIDAGEIQEGLVMATHLWRFWQIRSHLAEGRAWLTELVNHPRSKDNAANRAAALIGLGGLTYWQNDYPTTRLHYEEALSTFESIGDDRGIAEALYNIGFLFLIDGDTERSREVHGRSLAIYKSLNDELNAAFAQWGLAMSFIRDRRLDEAGRLGRESLDTFERHHNWFGRSLGEFVLVQIDRIMGDHDKVLGTIRDSLQRPESQKDVGTMSSLLEIQANAEIATGHPRRGLKLAAAAEHLRSEYGGGAPPPLLDLDDPRDLARGELSEQAIESAWAEGRQMSVEETLAYAQKDSESDE
jgi:tetratricopeptide (TPR) repeat protein